MAKLCYYVVFGIIIPTTKHEIMLHAMSYKDVDEMRSHILKAWDELDQRVIATAVRQWRTRFRAR